MRRRIKAGVSFADITPSRGVELGGYPYYRRANTGVHDPLVAAALVLSEDEATVLVIATDLFWITRAQADSIRKGVAEETGIGFDSIIVTASHTHSAPWMSVMFGASDEEPDFVTRIDEDYIDYVRRQCVYAAKCAVDSSFEATIELGVDRCGADKGVGGNRRDPHEGATDPELPALVVKDDKANVRAIWTKYSLHPTILHGENTLVSADFPGSLRAGIASALPEAVLAYSMGTAGDQSPRYYAESKDFDDVDRFGAALSQSLLCAVDSAESLENGRLAIARREVSLAPRRYGPLSTIEADLEVLKRREQELKASGAPYVDIQNANLAVLGKECELNNARWGAAHSARRFEACSPFEIVGVALDRRTAVVFLPGEVFCDFGIAITAASPFVRTFVVTLSNGDLPGYCVTAQAREVGGYEPGNSLLDVTSGPRLVAAALSVLSDLYEEEGESDGIQ